MPLLHLRLQAGLITVYPNKGRLKDFLTVRLMINHVTYWPQFRQ